MTVYFLSRATELFGLHCGYLTSTQKFRISPRVSYTHTEIWDISTGLLHPHRNFGYHHRSLTPTQKFWISPLVSYTHTEIQISPRVSYTHTEISDISMGLLHPHRDFGYHHGYLTPTQKFWISPRVFYTHTEIRDISPGLLHPHRNSGYLLGSFTPTQKFWISPRVSYTHTEIQDISPGLLHPHRTFRILPRVSITLIPGFSPEGINDPLLALPNTH